jgi:hypothetical protein
MLVMKERQRAIRTLQGWAISILLEAGAIHECEEHGWMKDRADPHARERALVIARHDPPPSVSLGQNQRSRSAREKFWSTSDTPSEEPRFHPSRGARVLDPSCAPVSLAYVRAVSTR